VQSQSCLLVYVCIVRNWKRRTAIINIRTHATPPALATIVSHRIRAL